MLAVHSIWSIALQVILSVLLMSLPLSNYIAAAGFIIIGLLSMTSIGVKYYKIESDIRAKKEQQFLALERQSGFDLLN